MKKDDMNKPFYTRFLFRPIINLIKRVAFEGYGSNLCLEEDFLPVPVHFSSPIPDIIDLKRRKIWMKKGKLSGIDFKIKEQLHLLKELGKKYQKECQWSAKPTANQVDFFTNNQSFGFGCAAILHSMIREFQPKNIIEIGSGNSSKIISEALKLNKGKVNYIIIDPYPPDYIRQRKIEYNRMIKKRVELLDSRFFDQLKKDDILFIDSSHTVKIGGDVNFLYLEVLPRLNPGVIVHIHDIALPYEYPEIYATSEVFRQFWTEQYLLQSFLCFNPEFEILLAVGNIMVDYPNIFRKAFPAYNDPQIDKVNSGSFWIRRK